jgi:hypothetical protein
MIDVELSAKSRILREEETIVSSIGNDSDYRHGETIGRLDSGSLIPILIRIL